MTLPSRILSARVRVEARLVRLFPGPFGHFVDVSPPDGEPPNARPERGVDARAALVVCLVAALSVALTGFLLWRARPQSADVGPVAASAVMASPAPAGASFLAATGAPIPTPTTSPTVASDDPGVMVDVQGKVRRPGVVNLPTGARVRDALNAVGGARPGVSTRSLNLAAPVSDGEQIVLGPACPDGAMAPAAPVAATSTTPAAPSRPVPAAAGLLDLNRASVAELETLPGVGPVLAQRIVDYRTTHGRFTSVDELREVSGIGPAKFAEIRTRVRV